MHGATVKMVPAVNFVLGAAGQKRTPYFVKLYFWTKLMTHKISFSIWLNVVDKMFYFNSCYICSNLHVTKSALILFFNLYPQPVLIIQITLEWKWLLTVW